MNECLSYSIAVRFWRFKSDIYSAIRSESKLHAYLKSVSLKLETAKSHCCRVKPTQVHSRIFWAKLLHCARQKCQIVAQRIECVYAMPYVLYNTVVFLRILRANWPLCIEYTLLLVFSHVSSRRQRLAVLYIFC